MGVVELSADAWSDYVNELRTCFGLLYANLVSFPEGGFDDLARWEPALRALFHGRPIYDADTVTLPPDLGRAFILDDADWPAFFDQTGFVHLRDVFTRAELARVSDEVVGQRLHVPPAAELDLERREAGHPRRALNCREESGDRIFSRVRTWGRSWRLVHGRPLSPDPPNPVV